MKNFRRPKTEDLCKWKFSKYRGPNIFLHEKFPNNKYWIVFVHKKFLNTKDFMNTKYWIVFIYKIIWIQNNKEDVPDVQEEWWQVFMNPVTENVTTPTTTVNILASMHTSPVLTSQCRGVAWYESECICTAGRTAVNNCGAMITSIIYLVYVVTMISIHSHLLLHVI